MEKMKLCVIGTGNESVNSHIPNFRLAQERVELAAVCDVNAALAEGVAARFGIPRFYADRVEMLRREKPDIVSVCVPNRFHKQIVCDALAHGCDVLCEKPPAIDGAEALEMQRAAEAAGRLLSYNFHYRFSPCVQAIRGMIERGRFGPIRQAKVTAVRRRGVPGWGNFTNKAIQGGGPLIDIGVHMLDSALYLMGYPEPAYVCASASHGLGARGGVGMYGGYDGARYTVEDALAGYIQFKDGCALQLQTSFILNTREPQRMNVELFGEEMGASVFEGEIYRTDPDGLNHDERLAFPTQVNLKSRSILDFVDCCATRRTPCVTPGQGTGLMRLVDALYRSAELCKPILFEE